MTKTFLRGQSCEQALPAKPGTGQTRLLVYAIPFSLLLAVGCNAGQGTSTGDKLVSFGPQDDCAEGFKPTFAQVTRLRCDAVWSEWEIRDPVGGTAAIQAVQLLDETSGRVADLRPENSTTRNKWKGHPPGGQLSVGSLVGLRVVHTNGDVAYSEPFAYCAEPRPSLAECSAVQSCNTATNMLDNCDFASNLEGWSLYSRGNAAAELSLVDSGAYLNISNPGSFRYELEFRPSLQDNQPDTQGSGIYTIRFRAKADAPRNIDVVVQEWNTWAMLFDVPVALQTTMQQYEVGPVKIPANSERTYFTFKLGLSDINVTFDDIVFEPVSSSTGSDPEPTTDPEPTADPEPTTDPTPETNSNPNPWASGNSGSSQGWTAIRPSSDTRTIYVSSSQGNDSNDGRNPSASVRSLSRAVQLARNGYPDHILLRRGDVWTDQHLGRFLSGRSASEPLVMAYYGTSGARPLLEVSANFIDHGGSAYSNFALIGLNIVGYRMNRDDRRFQGREHTYLRFVGGGNNILIEDCRFRFVEIVVQNYGGHTYRNFRLRRSIVLDVWAPNTSNANSSRPSGIYASGVDGLVIEENVFDHNGWSERVSGAGANMYNHNIYLQSDCVGNRVVVRGNIVTRGSSHGVHGRPGGLYEDNLFVRNSVSLQMGYHDAGPLSSGTFARARNNVILHGKLMNRNNSSWPRTSAVWGLHLDNLGSANVQVSGNIVARRDESGNNVGIRNYGGVSYSGNIQHNWGGGVGDTGNSNWSDPNRDLASYHRSLGRTPTREAFLNTVRNRPLREWNQAYTARAVNTYIRAGF